MGRRGWRRRPGGFGGLAYSAFEFTLSQAGTAYANAVATGGEGGAAGAPGNAGAPAAGPGGPEESAAWIEHRRQRQVKCR